MVGKAVEDRWIAVVVVAGFAIAIVDEVAPDCLGAESLASLAIPLRPHRERASLAVAHILERFVRVRIASLAARMPDLLGNVEVVDSRRRTTNT